MLFNKFPKMHELNFCSNSFQTDVIFFKNDHIPNAAILSAHSLCSPTLLGFKNTFFYKPEHRILKQIVYIFLGAGSEEKIPLVPGEP